MFTIKITEKKKEKMAEHAEKALKHLGKLMQCVEELGEENGMGERYNYRNNMGGGNMGGRYGSRMGERDDWDEEDDENYPMGERRRRSSSGRYM